KLERQSGTGLNLWNRSVLGFDPDQEIRADPDLADAWAVGEAMTSDEAVAYARETSAQAGAARSRLGNATSA
ncbi:MAG TPA: hypothetical protein VEW95_12520, partial [Candidatus Limnocylindrales bacterium]|nr:hypothetical protein [Candidatus Limnocylindrales bacterium]